jgi:hypothetical protein
MELILIIVYYCCRLAAAADKLFGVAPSIRPI